uniref:DDE-1 domain-containing protein n=1 Tax=Steinernema glaseri TaxID=37863 RepID=A0A1I8AL91_9BILA
MQYIDFDATLTSSRPSFLVIAIGMENGALWWPFTQKVNRLDMFTLPKTTLKNCGPLQGVKSFFTTKPVMEFYASYAKTFSVPKNDPKSEGENADRPWEALVLRCGQSRNRVKAVMRAKAYQVGPSVDASTRSFAVTPRVPITPRGPITTWPLGALDHPRPLHP